MWFFFVPEGIYRLDMTKKEVTTLKSPENEPKMIQKAEIFDLNSLEIPPKIP